MTNNFAIIFSFAAMLGWSFSDFLIQKMSRLLGSFEALICINIIGSLGLFPFVIKDLPLIITTNNLPYLIAVGLIDIVFGLAILKAYELGKLSVVEVILTLELPFTILFGYIFLKEQLDLIQLALILIILLGVFLISKRSQTVWDKIFSGFTRHGLEAGVLVAFVAAFLSGVFNFFIALNSRSTSPIATVWFAWTLSAVLTAVFYFAKHGNKTVIEKFSENLNLIIFGSLLNTAAWLFYAIATANKNLSIVTAITESYPAFSIFLGIKYNREKISRLQFLGAAIAIIASVIIGFVS